MNSLAATPVLAVLRNPARALSMPHSCSTNDRLALVAVDASSSSSRIESTVDSFHYLPFNNLRWVRVRSPIRQRLRPLPGCPRRTPRSRGFLARDATDYSCGGRVCARDIVTAKPRRLGKTVMLTEFFRVLLKRRVNDMGLPVVAASRQPHRRSAPSGDEKIHASHNCWEGNLRPRTKRGRPVRLGVSGGVYEH